MSKSPQSQSHVISFRVTDPILRCAIAHHQAKHSNSSASKNDIFRSLALDAIAASPTIERLSELTDSIHKLRGDVHTVQSSIAKLQTIQNFCWAKFFAHFAEDSELFEDLTNLLEDDSDEL